MAPAARHDRPHATPLNEHPAAIRVARSRSGGGPLMGYLERIHHGESSHRFPAAVASCASWRRRWCSLRASPRSSSAVINLGHRVRRRHAVGGQGARRVSVGDARDFLRPSGRRRSQDPDRRTATRLRIQSQLKDPARATEVKVELEKLGTVDTVNSVGPTWGDEITRKAITALVIFFVLLSASTSRGASSGAWLSARWSP